MRYITILSISLLLAHSCKDEKAPLGDSTKAIPVRTATVNFENGAHFLTTSGKVQAANSAEIGTRTMGQIGKVYVKVGNQVEKDQLLIAINNNDLEAKRAQLSAGVAQARAMFENAERDYGRFKNLFAENSASQKELEDMTVQYEMAKAQLDGAEEMKKEVNAQFAYTNIRAPFKGKITQVFMETGDMAGPGMPLLAMEGPGVFEVTTMVPENKIMEIQNGAKVQVLVKSVDKTFSGTVSEISTSAKNTDGQYLVTVTLDKAEGALLSGMYGTVRFPIAGNALPNTVLVPTEALVINGQLIGIYTIGHNNTAILRWLRPGRTYGDTTEVLSGLAAGETYIVDAESQLYNGAKISLQKDL